MARRRPRWFLLAAVFACLGLAAFQLVRSHSAAGWGRGLFLHEGPMELVQVEDAVTFVVRGLEDPSRRYNGPFRLRLMGVERQAPTEETAAAALARTEQLLAPGPGRTVHVVFDRQRFDETETPTGYLFVEGVCLNTELLRKGLVRLKRPAGLPSKSMRDLIQAANEAALRSATRSATNLENPLATVE